MKKEFELWWKKNVELFCCKWIFQVRKWCLNNGKVHPAVCVELKICFTGFYRRQNKRVSAKCAQYVISTLKTKEIYINYIVSRRLSARFQDIGFFLRNTWQNNFIIDVIYKSWEAVDSSKMPDFIIKKEFFGEFSFGSVTPFSMFESPRIFPKSIF